MGRFKKKLHKTAQNYTKLHKTAQNCTRQIPNVES
jgi:hypothetical protein